MTLATKIIADQVRRAGLVDILGSAGSKNIQGETVQKLDILANQAMHHCLGSRGNVALMASEENEEPSSSIANGSSASMSSSSIRSTAPATSTSTSGSARFFRSCVAGPPPANSAPAQRRASAGPRQVAAGYVVYGSSTMLVYTTGNGVHGFTLDPAIGAYLISHENIRMPPQGSLYSVNEANADSFPEGYRHYLGHLRSGAAGRQVFLALHRLAGGGLSSHAAQGRHLSLSADKQVSQRQAAAPVRGQSDRVPGGASNGAASDGTQRILEKRPQSLHERTALMAGSKAEMEMLHAFL